MTVIQAVDDAPGPLPPTTTMSAETIEPGHGRIVVRNDGFSNVFSELSAAYPLKLLSPQIPSSDVSVVYMLSYGGGLVGGDCVQLRAEVLDGARLAMLSQGSTKVFKTRPGHRLAALVEAGATTQQKLAVRVSPGSALFLLPDPVTCFRDAKYHQSQTFHLAKESSAVLLDWITSGRKSLGEEWAFSRYYSLNEVFVDGKRIARDATLLDEPDSPEGPLIPRTLAQRMAPYSCYATVIMYGDLVKRTCQNLSAAYSAITVFKQNRPPPLLWSLSPICDEKGWVLRVAGKDTEDVKVWLGKALSDLESVLGVDVYRRAFS
ncbi:UreD-domain-containing protein [Trametes sanguinea]|nr:UreD-domain-containing protein [Trametes sanguinea]